MIEQLTLAGAVSVRIPRFDLDPDLENRVEREAGEGNDWRESREKSGESLSGVYSASDLERCAYDRLAYMYSRTDRAEELTETASFPKP